MIGSLKGMDEVVLTIAIMVVLSVVLLLGIIIVMLGIVVMKDLKEPSGGSYALMRKDAYQNGLQQGRKNCNHEWWNALPADLRDKYFGPKEETGTAQKKED